MEHTFKLNDKVLLRGKEYIIAATKEIPLKHRYNARPDTYPENWADFLLYRDLPNEQHEYVNCSASDLRPFEG